MDELAPPKATITSIIKEKVGNAKFSAQYTDTVIEISKKFISKLSAESNQICLKDNKKTIAPDHVFRALKQLQLDEYTKELNEAHEAYLKDVEKKSKMKSKLDFDEDSEKLNELQQQLFLNSRNHSIEAMQNGVIDVNLASGAQIVAQSNGGAKGSLENIKPQFQQQEDEEDYEN